MPYFDEPVGRVKIQTTSTNSQRYYTTKRLIRYIYYPTRQIFMCVHANFADIYLRGMRDRSMRSGTELAREIQLTDWSTAGEEGETGFRGFDHAITFHNGKKIVFRSPKLQINSSFSL